MYELIANGAPIDYWVNHTLASVDVLFDSAANVFREKLLRAY
ncbi:MAG: hypothetical protein ACI9KM_001206 [Rubritalea sp.]|jgi:hypothetical protein